MNTVETTSTPSTRRVASIGIGLIAKLRWTKLLLRKDDPKTWEIRGSSTKVRGPVCLIASGVQGVMGEAELVDSKPLTKEMYDANMDKHKTGCWEQVAGRYKKPHIWVFQHGQQYKMPVRVPRKKGQVIWARW